MIQYSCVVLRGQGRKKVKREVKNNQEQAVKQSAQHNNSCRYCIMMCVCVFLSSAGNVLLLATARALLFPGNPLALISRDSAARDFHLYCLSPGFLSSLLHSPRALFLLQLLLIEHGSQDHGEDALGRPAGLVGCLVLDLVASHAERLSRTLRNRTTGSISIFFAFFCIFCIEIRKIFLLFFEARSCSRPDAFLHLALEVSLTHVKLLIAFFAECRLFLDAAVSFWPTIRNIHARIMSTALCNSRRWSLLLIFFRVITRLITTFYR